MNKKMLNQRIAELTIELNDEINQKHILVEEVKTLNSEKVLLDKQLQYAVCSFNELMSSSEAKDARIDKASTFYKALKAEKKELSSRVETAAFEYKKLKVEYNAERAAVAKLEVEKKSLQKKIADLEAESKADKQKIAELQEKLVKALAWYNATKETALYDTVSTSKKGDK